MAELGLDLTDAFEKWKKLTTEEMVNGLKRGMRKAAREIRETTVENARQGIKTYNNHAQGQYKNKWGEYEQENILDAVRVGKMKDNYDEELFIKVHVMGTGRENSKTFRFRFLEKGTKDRYALTRNGKALKKQRYLGRIQPRRYFGRAKQSVDVEGIYLKEIKKSIEKVNNT